jgi:hypothetical protein
MMYTQTKNKKKKPRSTLTNKISHHEQKHQHEDNSTVKGGRIPKQDPQSREEQEGTPRKTKLKRGKKKKQVNLDGIQRCSACFLDSLGMVLSLFPMMAMMMMMAMSWRWLRYRMW